MFEKQKHIRAPAVDIQMRRSSIFSVRIQIEKATIRKSPPKRASQLMKTFLVPTTQTTTTSILSLSLVLASFPSWNDATDANKNFLTTYFLSNMLLLKGLFLIHYYLDGQVVSAIESEVIFSRQKNLRL